MAGIYVHIPFCRRKCGYCNFFSVVSLKHKDAVVEAINKEIALSVQWLEGEDVDSVYFGGGTPSLLDAAELGGLLQNIARHHHLANDCEITLEANPEDITPVKVKGFRAAGINRVSIGIQSFFREDLDYLERIHAPEESREALENLATAGLQSFSADLIYGIPGQTETMLVHNLRQCLECGTPHISCYCITVEPKTKLQVRIKQGIRQPPAEEDFLAHFNLIIQTLCNEGYLHYEISNFALEGHLARHNTAYWLDRRYLGLGPSAHSYNLVSRRWNHPSVIRYLDGIKHGSGTEAEERLSETDHCNEMIMTRLRTMWGLDLDAMEARFGLTISLQVRKSADPFLRIGLLRMKGNNIFLTDEGKSLADHVSASLFVSGG